jgi:hypothetical protein
MAYKPFKMKGHTLPGIKQREADKMEDGRPGSSAFQYKESPAKQGLILDKRTDKQKIKDQKSEKLWDKTVNVDNIPGFSKKKSKMQKQMEEHKSMKETKSPAKQTKFPNSPGAMKRKKKKFIKKVSKMMSEGLKDTRAKSFEKFINTSVPGDSNFEKFIKKKDSNKEK